VRRSILCVLVTAVMGLGTLVAIGSRPVFAAGAEQDVPQADHAFMQALGTSDKAAVAPLLDPALIWTDWEGKTQDRTQVLEHLPASTVSDAGSKSYTYDQVVTVRTDSGKLHVLRVWVKRPSGWRLLIYHEVKQAEKAGATAPPVKECINPCQTVPYQPKNDAEAGVIKSWQALETAVTAGDGQAWAPHFADEFVVIGSGATDPVTKEGRIAILNSQKQAGTNGAPAGLAPDHTRMFTIGDTVVMNCQTLPHRGKPAHITRVWIKRGGMWRMTVSFQTTIQAAVPVADK
jgi:Domain of unknown function (DUF4440)